eukprot:scaffold45856_cov55-Phaeocystis_antarctica.AAC.2
MTLHTCLGSGYGSGDGSGDGRTLGSWLGSRLGLRGRVSMAPDVRGSVFRVVLYHSLAALTSAEAILTVAMLTTSILTPHLCRGQPHSPRVPLAAAQVGRHDLARGRGRGLGLGATAG